VKMQQITVPITFKGELTVSVPRRMKPGDAQLLAEKLALSRVVASFDNPDAPDEDAFYAYLDGCSTPLNADADWDASKVTGVSGVFKSGDQP
jgi:hypothetical protein